MNKYGLFATLISMILLLQLLPSARKEQYCIPGYEPNMSQYRLNIDGTAHHKSSELTWERCLVGQKFNNSGTPNNFSDDRCDGKPTKMNWPDLHQAIKLRPDVRLPSIAELEATMVVGCNAPVVNLNIFPGTPYKGRLMSSDENVKNNEKTTGYFYALSLYSSSMLIFQKNSRAYVRLIIEKAVIENDTPPLTKIPLNTETPDINHESVESKQ